MANFEISDVGIFDDFDDPKKMSSTVCQQVPMKEYEEDISSETDKALGSKMMKLVHGEDYPECLVSLAECVEQTSSLKMGMCKTFQYSEEVKGTPNRHSKRLAAKRNACTKQELGKSNRIQKEVLTPHLHPNNKSKACPLPPTPPPLPPSPPLTITAQQGPRSATRKSLSSLTLNVESQNHLSQRRSPRVGKGGDGGKSELKGSKDDLTLPSQKESPFLTPMVTRKKSHKRSSSISSAGSGTSVSSMGSMKSIQSEIMSSNPISRLKVTQIARSPGGTPLRPQIPGQQPSDPLHKALVTAMKTKFKNVNTPSPGSRNASLNGSDISSF